MEGERAAWREQTDTLQHERAALQAEVKLLRVERDLYKERAEVIARRLFAAKSEQRGLHQRDLFFNEAEAESARALLKRIRRGEVPDAFVRRDVYLRKVRTTG